MALPETYHFSRRFNKCAVTEVPFIDGDEIWTGIFLGLSDDGYLRKDFSLEGWEKRLEEDLTPFSSWKSKWKKPQKMEEEKPLIKETAETLLNKLAEEDAPETEKTRYILALMLERAKLLVETDAQEVPDGILRIYRHKKTDENYIIKDPNLPLDQIAGLQAEVAEKLG